MTTETHEPISPLVAQLIDATLAASATTTNALIDGLTQNVEKSEAMIDAIRFGVEELLSGDFMPSPDAIRRVLYPQPELVDRFRRGKEAR